MYQADFAIKEPINPYRLSVLMMPGSLFYAVFGPDGDMQMHASVADARYSDAALFDKIRSHVGEMVFPGGVHVVVVPHYHFSVPAPDHSLVGLFPGMENAAVMMHRIPGQTIYQYYSLTLPQKSWLDRLFGPGGYVLRSYAWLMGSHYIADESTFLHVHIEPGVCLIYASAEMKMVFCNHFEWSAAEDVLYFIQSVFQSSGLHQASCRVIVSGWVEKGSQLMKLLSSYYANVTFARDYLPAITGVSDKQNTDYYYFIHYVNNKCE